MNDSTLHDTRTHAHVHVAEMMSLPLWRREDDNHSESTLTLVQMMTKEQARDLASNKSRSWSFQKPLWIPDSLETSSTRKDDFRYTTNLRITLPGPSCNGTKSEQELLVATWRALGRLLGRSRPIRVLDVTLQEELQGWTVGDLMDYFIGPQRNIQEVEPQHESGNGQATTTTYSPGRNPSHAIEPTTLSKCTPLPSISSQTRRTSPPRRAHLSQASSKPNQMVLNQISLEISDTPLVAHVWSPQIVRNTDWIDQAWPGRRPRSNTDTDPVTLLQPSDSLDIPTVYPKVQYYCLTSAGGSFTDFHIDFGGSSVWYHVHVGGPKVFCLIAPSDSNLQYYEEWLRRADQSVLFLPKYIVQKTQQKDPRMSEMDTNALYRRCGIVTLKVQQSQTLFIPSGWIHAVYTKRDSIVFGGNFLHGHAMRLQVAVHALEQRCRIPNHCQFPFFVPLQFYAGGMYFRRLVALSSTENLSESLLSEHELRELPHLLSALEQWWKQEVEKGQVAERPRAEGPSIRQAAEYATRSNGCQTVPEFLTQLRIEHAKACKRFCPNILKDLPASTESLAAPSPTSRPKVRIKLKKTASDGTKVDSKAKDDTTEKSTFRIRLSRESSQAAEVPADVLFNRKSPVRETSNWLIDEREVLKDEEWVPSPSSHHHPDSPNITSRRKSGSNTKAGASRRPSKKAKPSTARQRLFKKLG